MMLGPATQHGHESRAAQARWFPVALFLVTLSGAALRLLRLDWQPLWWDEGYSAYFATEPLARMVWLTAHDIHPPLYFALAHGWTTLLDAYSPVVFRSLSILVGLPAIPLTGLLTLRAAPHRHGLALVAATLVAASPMHIFYSQEVRMYGLALSLALASTLALHYYAQQAATGRRALRAGLLYALLAALALYALYYVALLLVAHALWLVYIPPRHMDSRQLDPRQRLRRLWPLLAVALLYSPWILYAAPKLWAYIQSKVVADQDLPLDPITYLLRHLLAFTGGHVEPTQSLGPLPPDWLSQLRFAGLAALLWLIVIGVVARFRATAHSSTANFTPRAWLWLCLLVPALLGYAINLVYPFFPQGGERLLFFVLPYFVIGVVLQVASLAQAWQRSVLFGLLTLAATAGILTYFTTPRYVDEDYRPVVHAAIHNGRPQDTVLAIFPWQIGYWRAYAPRVHDAWLEPQPHRLDQEFLEWNPALQQRIDQALAQGTVWFPAPLGFGSTLPHEIEDYLRSRAANAYDRWHSPTTRLSAWVTSDAASTPIELIPDRAATTAATTAAAAKHAAAMLASATISANNPGADNEPVIVDLHWQANTPPEQRATLLLQDTHGRTWATRSYAPLGLYQWSQLAGQDAVGNANDKVALLIPPGTPPGPYTLGLQVTPLASEDGAAVALDAATPLPATADAVGSAGSEVLPLAELEVTRPGVSVPPQRVPAVTDPVRWFDAQAQPTTELGGLRVLGLSQSTLVRDFMLAGTHLDTMLYLAVDASPAPATTLQLELRAPDGTVVADASSWPLPDHPPASWQAGDLIAAPMSLFVPGYVAAGTDYTLWAGLATPEDSHVQAIGPISITRRAHVQTPPAGIPFSLDPPIQFGTHALLLGFGISDQNATDEVGTSADAAPSAPPTPPTLTLYWQVLQPIVPPHHVFVHYIDATGVRIAQSDGKPTTADGPAPTGSWIPGEFIATVHELPRGRVSQLDVAQVGLYNPQVQVRLPASQDDVGLGDTAQLPIHPPAPPE